MAKKGKKASTSAADAAPPEPLNVRDLDVIGQDATTRAQRRAVLVAALANDWAAEDIDTIERIDQAGWHGWSMWPIG
jgi:hypothetical protein